MAIKSLGAVSDAMWCALAFSVNERNERRAEYDLQLYVSSCGVVTLPQPE